MRRAAAILLALVGLACLPAVAAASGPPTIEYLSPHPLRNHEATVHFTVDPEGLETTYEVQYGSKAGEYKPNNYLWTRELPAGDEPVAGQAAFPAYFEGQLSAGKEYHWRVVAENSAGKTEGSDEVFTTTEGSPPRTETLAATEQTTSSAVMHGLIYPEGAPVTRCWFQVVSEGNLEQRGWVWHGALGEPILMGELVPCAETPGEIGTGLGPVPVHAAITGLEAKPYEYRLGAANEYEDRWFSEPALIGPVWVKTQGAEPVGASEASVQGFIYKQEHGEAAYWVEYGIGGLGQKTSIGWLGALGREYDLEVTLPCLQPNSEYTYRFAGMNGAGTVYGSEETFHTVAGESAGCSPSQPGQPAGTSAPPPPATSSKAARHKHHRKHRKHRHHRHHHG
jgi:hypothetical protein